MNALRRKILQELLDMIGMMLALSTGTERLLTPEPWERLLAATTAIKQMVEQLQLPTGAE